MKLLLKNFRIVDENTDTEGSVVIEDGIITRVPGRDENEKDEAAGTAGGHAVGPAVIIDGGNFFSKNRGGLPVLMPAFVDLHAHFREPAFCGPETPFPAEVLESASLAAAAGGFGTVVCMANTKPATDTVEKAAALKARSDALGLVDLYPVVSLTKEMEGKELSGITFLPAGGEAQGGVYVPLMISEDGRDVADDGLFLAAMREARRAGIPVSCHCDFGGGEAEAQKKAGEPRSVWSRTEENNAVRRAIELGKKAGCRIHIAHVSTKEAAEMIRRVKAEAPASGASAGDGGFAISCEAMPHNLALTETDAANLGAESFGRVNPPLRREEDRQALIRAVMDGTVDAIATDHAPHSLAGKEKGAPGFSGLETAFAAACSVLVKEGKLGLPELSRLMSANPARIIGLFDGKPGGRGRIARGYRADLVIVDPEEKWIVNPGGLKTRGKNTPFAGRQLRGGVVMTIHNGRVVFERAARQDNPEL